MIKRILFIVTIVSFFGAFTLAQEKVDKVNSGTKDCSMKCCSNKEINSNTNLEINKEAQLNKGRSDSILQELHHGKKSGNNKTETNLKIWNKVCPVRGEEVNPNAPTILFNGKVIGFCCPGCDSKFQKSPEKYLKNLNEDGSEFIGS